jgi:hypothetical protein
MKIHGTAKGAALSTKDFGVAFGGATVTPFDDTGLKAYYKFDETSGDIIEQSESDVALGSSADIQITGSPTYDDPSAPDSFSASMLFDGSTALGIAGSSTSQFNFLSKGDIQSTVCMWIRQLSVPSGGFEPCWIDSSGSTASNVGCAFLQYPTMKLLYYISNGSGAHYALLDCGDDYIPDVTLWHFYVGTFDYDLGSNNQKMRRDNSNLKQGTPVGNSATTDSEYPLNFMYNPRVAIPAFMNAYCCEFSFWSKVMSTDDQTSLYNEGAGREIY